MSEKKNRLAAALAQSVTEEAKSVSSDAQRARDRFRLADKLENVNGVIVEPSRPDPEPPDRIAQEVGISVVDISKVFENPLNARRLYNDEIVKERAASIATAGQLTPVPVIRNNDIPGTFILIDGHYRRRALLSLGRREIRIEIKEIADRLDLYRLSYALNDQRSGQTALDNSLAWTALLDKGEANLEQISQVTGASKARISKTISIGKLSPAVFERISVTPSTFGIEMLYELFLYEQKQGETKAISLADKIIRDDLSTRDVAQIRKNEELVRSRKTKEISRQYKIRSGDSEIGYIKDWDSGRLVFEISPTDAAVKESLLEELKALAEKYGRISH